MKARILKGIFLSVLSFAGPALAASSFDDAIKKGKPILNFRYRFGYLEDKSTKHGYASTVQSLIGFETAPWRSMQGKMVLGNVSRVGSQKYNDGVNNKTQYPLEMDPGYTFVDESYLKYSGLGGMDVSVGRKKLEFSNGRMISSDPWRQHNQSFDGVFVDGDYFADMKLQYAFSTNFHTPLTKQSPVGNMNGNFHMANLSYDGLSFGELNFYGLFMKVKEAGNFVYDPYLGNILANQFASNTYGANFEGDYDFKKDFGINYAFEYARQKSTKKNPISYKLDYWRVNPGMRWQDFEFGINIETFKTNGTFAFQTFFGDHDKFNGWSETFRVIPLTYGLRDLSYNASYTLHGADVPYVVNHLRLDASIHRFRSTKGGISLGREWDLALVKPFGQNYKLMLKYANYNAVNYGNSSEKMYLQFSAKY